MKKKAKLLEKSDDSDIIYKYGPEYNEGLKEYYPSTIHAFMFM